MKKAIPDATAFPKRRADEESDRPKLWIPALVCFGVALALRLIYLSEFAKTIYYNYPIIDALAYDARGWAIAQGDWLGDRIFYQDPLYPYFLGIVYRLFGHSYTVVYVLQILLSAATCALTAWVAQRTFSHHKHANKIAWGAGLAAALATPMIYYSALIIKTSLGLFLSMLHLWALQRTGDHAEENSPHRVAALFTGVLLGLNCLNRGNYLLLAPFFALWLFGRLRRSTIVSAEGDAPSRPWIGPGLTAAALYTAGTLAVVLPVTARNYAVGGEFVLITSQGGQNFYIGNHAENETGSYVTTDEIRANPKFEEIDFLAMAQRETGRQMKPTEASNYYFKRGWEWIESHPEDWADLYLKKWGLWLAGFEIPDNYDFGFIKRRFSHVLKIPIATSYTYGLAGWGAIFLGLIAWRKRDFALSPAANPNLLLVVGFVLIYSLSITLFFVFSRYRIPIQPILILLSAGAVGWLISDWKKIRSPMRWAFLFPFLLAGFFSFRPLLQPNWAHWALNDDSIAFFNLGTIHLEADETEQALAFFEKAVAENQANAMALNEIGLMYWQRFGRIEEASDIFRRLVDSNPNGMGAWHNLGFTLAIQRKFEEAEKAFLRAEELRPDLASPTLNLAHIRFATDRIRLARAGYRSYVQKQIKQPDPESIDGMRDAAKVLLDAPDLADFQVGLNALAMIPQRDPANPDWTRALAGFRANPAREKILRAFLENQLETKVLSPEARSLILTRLQRERGQPIYPNSPGRP